MNIKFSQNSIFPKNRHRLSSTLNWNDEKLKLALQEIFENKNIKEVEVHQRGITVYFEGEKE